MLVCSGLIAFVYVLVLLRLRYLRRLLKLGAKGRRGAIYGFTDLGQLMPVVKIGRAKHPQERLKAHRCAAPFGLFTYFILRVPNDRQAEYALHTLYARWRVRKSGEWFWLTPLMLLDLFLLRLMS